MTPIQLSRDSLTYHVLSTYASVDRVVDTCTLRWQLVRASFMILLAIVAGATLGLFVLDTMVWVIAMIAMGMFIQPSVLAIITVALTAIISTIVGLAIAADAYNARRWRLRHEIAQQPPSAISAAYRSFKEKYCAPVEFV